MKKIYLFLVAFAFFFYEAEAQTLNESANWPNEAWTVTGEFNPIPAAFEFDPTTTANFAFDDDDAVNGNNDWIAAESPVINLTAAHAAGENSLEVIVNYGFRRNATVEVLRFEYWDADSAGWVAWVDIPSNYTPPPAVTDNFCTIPKTTFITSALNISSFTPTQLSGFRYRIFYDDNPNAAGWQYGFCFDSPTIQSISCGAPSDFVVSNLAQDGASIEWLAIEGINGYEYVFDEIDGDPAGAGTFITNNSYDASGLNPETTYYLHVRTICATTQSPWRQIMFTTNPLPPANDECSVAELLTVNPDFGCASIASGSLFGASDSGEGDNGVGLPDDDVWYSFVAESVSHRIVISNITGTPVDLVHEILSGSCGGGLTSVLVSDANTSNPSGLVIGETYYVRVFTFSSNPGATTTFDICIGTPPPPPANDTCAGAIDLANETSPLEASTVDAFNDNLNVCNNAGNSVANTHPDVYYSILVPSGSTLTIGQTANSYDSANIIFYGDCDNRTEIACYDDGDFTTTIWPNDTGSDQTVYFIQDGWSGSGTFTLAWSVVACTQATATYAVNSLCEGGGEEFEVVTDVTDFGSATSVTVSDDQGNSETITQPGLVTFGPYPNNTPVIVTVANDQDADCSITSPALNQLGCPPANDNCDAAELLTVNPDFGCASIASGTLIAATDSGEGDNGVGLPDDDVWYSFVAESISQRIVISNIAGTPIDLVHEILSGSCGGGLTSVLVSDANTSNPSGLVIGETYYVRVFTFSANPGATTTFDICIGTPPPPPANDTCAGAIDLANETSPLEASTAEAFNDNLNVCNNSGVSVANTHPDVYYSILVPSGSTLTIGQTENSYDSANIIFYGDCDNRTEIACYDDSDTTTTIWGNDTGSDQTVYFIQDGWSGSGTFTLAWSVVACTQATATFAVNSLCEGGGEEFEVVTDVTSLGSATSVTVSDDQGNTETITQPGLVTFGPYPNNTPVIVTVANDQDSDCSITSSTLNQLACPPANDNCDNAEALIVNEDLSCGSITSGSTLGATASPQADDVSGTPNNDVWYSFVALDTTHRVSLTNIVSVTPNSTTIDMGLGVYNGTGGCEALTLTATSDPETLNLTGLTVGDTYYVRVYGWYTAITSNTFDICIGSENLSIGENEFNNLKFYPNPVKDVLNLSFNQNISTVEVYNLLGQQVIAKNLSATAGQIDMSNLSSGAYVVKVTADNLVKTIRIVKE